MAFNDFQRMSIRSMSDSACIEPKKQRFAMTLASRRTIISSIAASIAFVMELTLVPLVLPAIQTFYDLTLSHVAWVFNSYGISVALGVIVGGLIGDAFNIKRVFATGVVMFALGAAIVAYAANFEMLIAGRVLQGFGGGIFSPLVPLLLTRTLPHRPGKILIIWGSLTGYVATFAPLALSQTITSTGWQSVFVLFAVLAGVALILSVKTEAGKFMPSAQKLPNLGLLFGTGDVWLVFGYIFCTYGAITFFLFRLPLWLADIDYSVNSIGLILATIWLSFSIVGTLLRNWVDSYHVRIIVLAAPFLIAASFLVVFFYHGIGWLTLSAALVGAGFACSNAPSTQLVLQFAPQSLSAICTSLDITFARLGGVAAVALLAQAGFAASVGSVVLLSFVALICALVFLRKVVDS